MFSSQIIIDLDETEHGWEVVARLSSEDIAGATTGVPEVSLRDAVNACAGAALLEVIAERDHQKKGGEHATD